MQKKFFEILVQTAFTVGLFWTILKLTPKSALLSFTILYLEEFPGSNFEKWQLFLVEFTNVSKGFCIKSGNYLLR